MHTALVAVFAVCMWCQKKPMKDLMLWDPSIICWTLKKYKNHATARCAEVHRDEIRS